MRKTGLDSQAITAAGVGGRWRTRTRAEHLTWASIPGGGGVAWLWKADVPDLCGGPDEGAVSGRAGGPPPPGGQAAASVAGSHARPNNVGDWISTPSARLSTDFSQVPVHAYGEAPPIVHEVLRSPGAPLDAGTRSLMEERLGADFADVRVHTDQAADRAARAVAAHAFTTGSHVVFGRGGYDTSSTAGRRAAYGDLTYVRAANLLTAAIDADNHDFAASPQASNRVDIHV